MELPSDNIIIYGHHMNDGSMFVGLMKFKDKNFWEKHKTVSFDNSMMFPIFLCIC